MRRKVSTIGAKRRRRSPARRTHTTRRRRRRISGIGGVDATGILMKAVALGAGAIAGRELDKIIKKMGLSISPTIYNIVLIGVGAFLPKMLKGNKFVADMADGVMANAVMQSMISLGVINGIGAAPNMVSYRINGNSPRLRTIAGGANLSAIAGGANLSAIAGNAIPGSGRTRTKRAGEGLY